MKKLIEWLEEVEANKAEDEQKRKDIEQEIKLNKWLMKSISLAEQGWQNWCYSKESAEN